MKIIIVGAGKVGWNLTKSLSDEKNEVYLIDENESVARRAGEKLDAKVIWGNAADPEILKAAKVQETDLVVAVTSSDETNLVVCSLAGMFGAKQRLARVRNTSLSSTLQEFGLSQFYIDEIINPELLTAQAIIKIINAPGASGVADFAGGKLLLRSFDVPENSPLCGMTIEELGDEDFPWPFLIVCVVRDKEIFIPNGSTRIEPNDFVYVLLPTASLGEFLTFVDPKMIQPEKIVIYGATMTGKHVAKAFQDRIREVVIIEENVQIAEALAGELGHVRIINGSPCDNDILVECGMEAADAYIATSDNDNANLISSVLAKRMGAKTSIITTQQPEYISITDALDVDSIINPHFLAVERILNLVRGKGISSVIKLLGSDAEALEIVPEKDSPVTKDLVKNIKFPNESIVGAIYRGHEAILVGGNTQIQEGDKVIVFCRPSAVKKIQKLFNQL